MHHGIEHTLVQTENTEYQNKSQLTLKHFNKTIITFQLLQWISLNGKQSFSLFTLLCLLLSTKCNYLYTTATKRGHEHID